MIVLLTEMSFLPSSLFRKTAQTSPNLTMTNMTLLFQDLEKVSVGVNYSCCSLFAFQTLERGSSDGCGGDGGLLTEENLQDHIHLPPIWLQGLGTRRWALLSPGPKLLRWSNELLGGRALGMGGRRP